VRAAGPSGPDLFPEFQGSATMARSPLHVVIIGGGIGGLCLAQGLKKAGVSASVYERDRTPTSRLQGYRIRISPRGGRALRDCLPPDLWTAFVGTCGRSPDSFRLLTHRMEVLIRVEVPEDSDEGRNYSASRAGLRRVLLSGLDDIVHFDRAFTRYESAPDGRITAFFEDGTSATGDLLVGADGGNSRVRRQLLPNAQRVDTGIRAIGGKVVLTDQARRRLAPDLLDGPTLVRAPGGRAMFLAVQEINPRGASDAPDRAGDVPVEADSAPGFGDTQSYLMWAASGRHEGSGFPADAGDLDGPALRDIAARACAGWHPAFAEMIRLTDPATVGLVKIRTSVPVPPWPTGRVTLLGDAIHSMTPYRGIGGNVALRDAELLGRQLAAADRGEIPLLTAIHDYEAAMIEYGFKAVRSSLQAAEHAHASGAIAFVIVNAMFRLVGAVPALKARMFSRNDDD
jgi:2-polyprenyl-6-methoxyphenol hydroxylase-like FAD-dependent oxidoreductase